MKAQILKIAGVKSEKEFYKKFPSEEAFMKKHGKELKKAQYGTYVAGQAEQPEQKPIAYDDLYQDTMSRITGISRQEKARQEGLDALKSSKSSGGSDGLAGLLGQAAGMMSKAGMFGGEGATAGETDIASSLAGALGKNGKKLKKAQSGDVVPADALDYMNQMPSDYQSSNLDNIGKDAFGGVKSFDFAKQDPRINPSAAIKTGLDWKGVLGKVAPALAMQAGPLIGSIEQIGQNKKDIKKANQWADISQIGAQAALSRPEISKRRYARPEDNLVTGANPLGKKDSLLAAQNGAEIANTFAPNTIYTDLGYEPLNDSDPKQFQNGGGLNLDPFAGIAGGIGGALGSAAGKGTGKGGPGSSIGSTIGGIAGSFIPIPGVGTALGSLAGGFIGGLFDSEDQNKLQAAQDRQAAAITQATLGTGASNLQKANKAFMQDGGYMNPEYNPQVIAKFGDYDVDQLLAPPHDADMLRAGGHLKEYTPPSARAMYTGRDLPYQMEEGGMMPSTNMMFDTDRYPRAEYGTQMAMGGDLQVHRGEAETLSYNPFLPDGGETIMFRGPSHDNGGMPISYGNNGVEVEGGEPAVKLQDGGSPDGNLVVYGNMVIPDYGVAELGDENAKGKKFKHYVDDLSKIEAKQNKLVDKTTQLINDADVNDQFDKLTLNTGQANLIGTTMKLKDIAEKKKTAAAVQNAILDTASEHGLESDALAKGKIKYAKANDPYAEFGAKLEEFKKGGKKGKAAKTPTLITAPSKDISTLSSFVKNIPYKERAQMAQVMGIPNYEGTAEQNDFLFKKQGYSDAGPLKVRTSLPVNIPTPVAALNKSIASGVYKPEVSNKPKGDNTDWWNTGLTALAGSLPFLRPSNQIPLDPSQLAGEMYSMANNQEEPVFAQSYQPLLSQGINISLQDQLNEITSQARSAERMAQGNPAALAMIASQAADAKNKVLGEQFRMNQGEAQRVAETNRQTMNEAQKANIGLYDQQQQRAAQAKSNTKLQEIAALNSISDKIAKNKLENKQLAISENLYNYRYSPSGVAYNLNPLAQFSPYGSGASASKATGELEPGKEFSYNKAGRIIGTHAVGKEDTAKNGKKISKGNQKNSSIVKAIKNL